MNGADFNTSLSKLVELILIHHICGSFNSIVSATGYGRNELAELYLVEYTHRFLCLLIKILGCVDSDNSVQRIFSCC